MSSLKVIVRALIVFPLIIWPGGSFAQECSEDHVDLRWQGGAVRFAAEIVENKEERAVGLMNRESMPRFSGMLFAYTREQPVAFWMKNTLIPLDMLFFDGNGVLQNVHHNAIPHDLTSIFGGEAIQYVLEINGGMVEKLGIESGAVLRHPVIHQHLAAWPC